MNSFCNSKEKVDAGSIAYSDGISSLAVDVAVSYSKKLLNYLIALSSS